MAWIVAAAIAPDNVENGIPEITASADGKPRRFISSPNELAQPCTMSRRLSWVCLSFLTKSALRSMASSCAFASISLNSDRVTPPVPAPSSTTNRADAGSAVCTTRRSRKLELGITEATTRGDLRNARKNVQLLFPIRSTLVSDNGRCKSPVAVVHLLLAHSTWRFAGRYKDQNLLPDWLSTRRAWPGSCP